ncbi:MAG: sulfatase [Bryobacterales bacterium]|nr:sulfatase [Bryobacterales bacterium]
MAALGQQAFGQSTAPPPNIVLILSDDHSAPYMGCYGDAEIRTPNLDRFASQGMRFAHAYTAAPQCVPSRTAMLTGRSPVGARMGRFSSPLPPDVVTLPELLRTKGYFTGVCRRWFHLDGPGRVGPTIKDLFERNHLLSWQRRVDWLDGNSSRAQTKAKLAEFFGKIPDKRPYFLWVNFNDPHHQWDKNALAKPHDPAKVRLTADVPDVPGMREDYRRYYDEIGRMDEEFQWVVDAVAARGDAENTIIIFMGDNGMALPRGKGSLYDRGLHVPLLVRWPKRVKAGQVCEDLVSGEDITPTLLAAAGAEQPKEMTGRSFLSALTGASGHKAREAVFGARLYHGNAPFAEDTKASTFDLSRCVRTKKWKLIYNCTPQMEYQPVDSARDAGWQEVVALHKAGTLKADWERIYFGKRPVMELYDLERDPAELTNLAGRPELAKVERELKVLLTEKMMVDYDYLPLPLSGNE